MNERGDPRSLLPASDESIGPPATGKPPDAGATGSGWFGYLTGCVVAPVFPIAFLGGIVLLDSLGIPLTEQQFAAAAARLPVAIPLLIVLVELVAWAVRRLRRSSTHPRAVHRGVALFLTALSIYVAIQVSLPIGRNSVDVTDKNSLTFQVFWPQRSWDLAWLYDCGIGSSSTEVSVSIGHTDVAANSNAGLIVVQRLSAGPLLVTVHAGGCQWHLMAGPDLNVSALAGAAATMLSGETTGSVVDADVPGTAAPLPLPTHDEVLFAYDCGAQTFSDYTDPAFDLLYSNQDPGHEVGGSLVRSFASNAWGLLVIRSVPFLDLTGSANEYVPPPGSETGDVATSCSWHVIVGRGLVVERPTLHFV